MNNAGDKALLFRFNELANLKISSFLSSEEKYFDDIYLPSFKGIGVKYYFSNNLAGKGAFLFGNNSSTQKVDIGGYSDEKWSSFGAGIEFGIQSDLVKSGSFLGYIGGMLGFIYLASTYEPSLPINRSRGTITNYDLSLTNFNLGGNLGFEYFIFERISFGAEYRFTIFSGSGSIEITRHNDSKIKSDLPSSFSIGFDTISFILAAYF
ncbi:MAG: outer membrane beta-barrel protein [Clostridia bacterium]|nr:outer membrane beta-barrel protein [Clostridia bacterium]